MVKRVVNPCVDSFLFWTNPQALWGGGGRGGTGKGGEGFHLFCVSLSSAHGYFQVPQAGQLQLQLGGCDRGRSVAFFLWLWFWFNEDMGGGAEGRAGGVEGSGGWSKGGVVRP